MLGTLPDATLRSAVCRLQVGRLDAIVGTLEPTTAFDGSFRPASKLV
jgi:hypothetical protein